MELEELTKTQIVLLVLLVSFVTSIATGIVTVSLLAQAPPAITQTVNHIIERTVTSVVPADGQAAAVITKETTVVVKEDELVTKSVAEALAKIGRVHADASTSSPVVALAALTQGSVLVTDASAVSGTHAVTFGDASFFYRTTTAIPELGIEFMVATGTAPSLPAFTTADAGSLKLGQTLIGLFGTNEDRIGVTTLSGTSKFAAVKAGASGVDARIIGTSLSTVAPGTPLITVFGDLIGVSTSASRADDKGSFIAMSDIANIAALLSKAATTSTPQ